MNFKLPLIAAFVAILGLSACGGGGSSGSDTGGSSAVTTLSKTDTAPGTGAEAVKDNILSVRYTLWLYSSTAAGNKGTQMETNTTAATPFNFVLGNGSVIAGWDQGLLGIKAGGKRTLIIPASLGYGAAGSGSIPGNQALVFDIEVVNLYQIGSPASLIKTDTVPGTGTVAAAGNTVTFNFSSFLYNPNATDFKGLPVGASTGAKFALTNTALIEGLVQGIKDMKVGGKRTLLVPAGLAYGTAGSTGVPPNAGLVYDIELTAVAVN